MKTLQPVSSFEQIKLLADPHRLRLLRMLLDRPATLTQLARVVRRTPAWVRHHIKVLESAGLVEIAEIRTQGIVTEKFYRARAGALLLQEIILPEGGLPVVLFSGSHDVAIEHLAGQLAGQLEIITRPVGSLDGLVDLRLGLCQVSGAHLRDEHGDYNTGYVRHLFPDRAVSMVTLAYRTQGLMIARGNPLGIRGLADLARPDVTFINRNPGSGTRLWLEAELEKLALPGGAVHGYDHAVHTHTESARAVAEQQADVALGLQAAAHQAGLDFIPLFEERYDFIFPHGPQPGVERLLDHIQTRSFRRSMTAMTGYESRHTGEQVL